MSSKVRWPKWSAVHWLTVALSVVTATDGLMRVLDGQTEHVETVYIRHESSAHVAKRSANDNPDELHVTFTAQNQPIKLRLKRHNQEATLPVYTLTNGQTVERPIRGTPRISFYHDVGHGASFIYSRNHNSSRPFDLDGSMFINGFEYILTPDHLVTWVGGGGAAHALKRLNSKLSFGHDGIDTRDPYTRFAAQVRAGQRRQRRLLREQQQGAQPSHGARRRRQTSEPEAHYVELSIVADYAVWKRFLEYTSGDEDMAFKELQHYYLFVVVMMDVRYRSVTEVDPTLKIRIVPVSLIVTDIQSEAVWTENYRVGRSFVQSINSLYALREWVRRGAGTPAADHTMLFSGYDLLGGRSDSSTIGVAFIGTACTYNSVSVIEEYFTGTSGTVSAHELGHSLDAEHDANYRTCSDLSSNVMSTQAVFPTQTDRLSNPWKFSACSVDAFGAFLETAKCTKDQPENSIETSHTAGVYFNADEQCRLVMGPKSYFCRSVQSRKGFNRMCRHLYCYLPDDPGYCGSIIASEFTVCGQRKWCSKGQCTTDSAAPSDISDTCPQGDEPGYQCSPDDCSDNKVKNVYCCQTCAVKNKTQSAPQEDEASKKSLNQADADYTTALITTTVATSLTTTISGIPDRGTDSLDITTTSRSIAAVTDSLDTTTSRSKTGVTDNLDTVTTTTSRSTAGRTNSLDNTTTTTTITTTSRPVTEVTESVGDKSSTTDLDTKGDQTPGINPTAEAANGETTPTAADTSSVGQQTEKLIPSATPTVLDVRNTDAITLLPTSTPSQPLKLLTPRTPEQMSTTVVTADKRTVSTTEEDLSTTPTEYTATEGNTATPMRKTTTVPFLDINNTEYVTLTLLTTKSTKSVMYESKPPTTTTAKTDPTTHQLGTDSSQSDSSKHRPTPSAGLRTTAMINSTSPTTLAPAEGRKTARPHPYTIHSTAVIGTDASPPRKYDSTAATTIPSTTPKSASTTPFILIFNASRKPTPATKRTTTLASAKSPPSTPPPRKTTTTTTTTSTEATCHSIYCMCVRCYSCYANVCNMFLPGGFYFKYIYGRLP